MSESPLAGTRILLGITGGIAAYKAAELTRLLVRAGVQVQVVLTPNGARFVTAQTFQALSGRDVRDSLWDATAEAAMGHIELARWADRIVIAPATADCIAKLAHGRADDLLSTLCLASAAPLTIAPAMNQQMWAHPATQASIETLRRRDVDVIGPANGDQACGDVGPGRMLEPAQIVDHLLAARPGGALDGQRVVVTAGPTHEAIDPVRFLGNRSSGLMGFAVAAAAHAAGANVTLIAGPVSLQTPRGVTRIDVISAEQMLVATLAAVTDADVLIAAAAVADFRVDRIAPHKIKKDGASLQLNLVANPDIVATVAALSKRPFIVGFAAETEHLETRAQTKLRDKRLDLIAANEVGADLGFERNDNALLLLWDGGREALARADKRKLAEQLIERIAERLSPRAGNLP